MKKAYRLSALVKGSRSFDFSVVIDGQTKLIVSNNHAVQYMTDVLGDRLYLSEYDCNKTVEENIASAKTHLATAWDFYEAQLSDNKKRAWVALHAEYNPIENYDRYEEGGYTDEHHKGTRTATNTNLINTPDLTTETTARTKVKTSSFVYGFDSASASPTGYSETEPTQGTDKTEQTGTNTTTGDATENYTEVSDISATVFDKDVHTSDNIHIHGNIGTTKNQDMVSDELRLREYNMEVRTIEDFCNMYTFYCDSLEVVE